jgi:hypothetical protein
MELESIQLSFNSKYATSYINNSHSNCEFYLPIIEIPVQHHIYISVQSVCIPYTFYNINSSNNELSYTENGSIDTIIRVDIGNYNSIQLATYLTTSMPNFKVTYNSITNRYYFLNSLYNFKFNSSSTILKILGFDRLQPLYLQSILKDLTSQFCANMQSVQCINIKCNFATGNIDSFDMKSSKSLCCFPVNVPPFSNIIYENKSNFRSNLFTNFISYLNLQITDQDNNIINLNGLDWTIVLQIDVVSFI